MVSFIETIAILYFTFLPFGHLQILNLFLNIFTVKYEHYKHFKIHFFFIKQKKFNLFPFYLQHFNTFIIRLPPYKLWQGKTHEKLWQGKAHEELWQGHKLWQGWKTLTWKTLLNIDKCILLYTSMSIYKHYVTYVILTHLIISFLFVFNFCFFNIHLFYLFYFYFSFSYSKLMYLFLYTTL